MSRQSVCAIGVRGLSFCCAIYSFHLCGKITHTRCITRHIDGRPDRILHIKCLKPQTEGTKRTKAASKHLQNRTVGVARRPASTSVLCDNAQLSEPCSCWPGVITGHNNTPLLRHSGALLWTVNNRCSRQVSLASSCTVQ